MDPDFLTLAQYQDSPTSTFPAEYGSQVDFRASTVIQGPQPLPPNFQVASFSSDGSSSSAASSAPVVEDTCYFMLERYVLCYSILSWFSIESNRSSSFHTHGEIGRSSN